MPPIRLCALPLVALLPLLITPATAQWRSPAPEPDAYYGEDLAPRSRPRPYDYRQPERPRSTAYGAPRADDDDDLGSGSAPPPSERFNSTPSRRSELDLEIDTQQSARQIVNDPTGEPAGTLVVDTRVRKLFLVQRDGGAIAYGIGVGRQGFEWKGTARIGRKAEWPSWTPPTAMLKRRPDLPTFMDGGVDNPLGARALYLYQGKRDTLFRIHGTNEPDTIGQAVSSGCIRMMNADVMDLYRRVKTGARVVVR